MTVSTDAAFTLADRGLGRIDYRAAPRRISGTA